jgi:TolB-like protein
MNEDQLTFGRFRADLRRRELWRDEKPVRLGNRALDILCVLISARGNVVTKDELMARVWPGVVVEENNIQVHVSALRKALDDEGNGQSCLVTVPGRGYRLIGVQAAPSAEPSASGRRRGAALPEKPSIAVLPFSNMSGDPEQEYLVDGIVEEITTALSRLPWLFVIARNSSFAYKGKSPDVRLVGQELGVRYVLEGSMRKSGDRIRVTGQLIDTKTGAHIWADRIDRAFEDVFELQDEVASKVVGAIEPKLLFSEIERATRKPTGSLDAYDLYLRALWWFHQLTKEGHAEAIRLLQQVLALDPDYRPPAAMIGLCRVLQAVQGWVTPSGAEVPESLRLAKQVIETGKDDPDVLWMAAFTLSHLAGEHVVAAAAVERALELNPNCAHAWMVNAYVHCFSNRPKQAIDSIQQAMRLSPLDPLGYFFRQCVALAYLFAHHYEEAAAWVDRSLAEQPRFLPALCVKVAACGHLGQTEEGRHWVGRLLAVHPHLTVSRSNRFAATFLVPEVLATYIEGLRKAGLPEE